MNYVLKSLLMCLFLLKGLVSWADDCVVEGIYYELDADKKEACVKPCGDGRYQGQVIIPSSIQVEGIEYTVTSIGEKAFDNCSKLYFVTIPNSVTSIRKGAFSFCYGLTAVTIPESVTSLGEHAFEGCSNLTTVKLPEGLKSIGEWAFAHTGLFTVTIPNSVESIGEWAFSGCGDMLSMKVKEGNTHYDSRKDCNAIIETSTNTLIASCKNTMMIPKSVKVIGNSAFNQCVDKMSITIPEGVTQIEDYAFNDCQGLRSVIIPDGVTTIGDAAFRGCRNLTSVNIPNSVAHIGESAFDCCVSLPSITLPQNLTTIGEGILYNCDMMEAVHCQGTIPPKVVINKSEGHVNLSTWRFEKPKQTAKTILYVPKGAKDAYRSAEYWKNFKIVEE